MRFRRLRLGSSQVPWAAAVAEKARRKWRGAEKVAREKADAVVRARVAGRINAEAMAGLVENVRAEAAAAAAAAKEEDEEKEE